MAKVWHGEYWKSKKNSPWLLGVLVVAVLWAYGHTSAVNGAGSGKHAGPSAPTSAKPTPGRPQRHAP